MTAAEFQASLKKPKAQIRLGKKREPNGIEAEYMRGLKRKHHTVLFEPFTLNLPGGVKYTPDLVAVGRFGGIMGIYEIKGPHIHNPASLVRFKSAKAAFPFWRFVFAQKTRSGEWATEE